MASIGPTNLADPRGHGPMSSENAANRPGSLRLARQVAMALSDGSIGGGGTYKPTHGPAFGTTQGPAYMPAHKSNLRHCLSAVAIHIGRGMLAIALLYEQF